MQLTRTHNGWNFEHDGVEFFYDEDRVWVPAGVLHPLYVFFVYCSRPDPDNDALWEVRRITAAAAIMDKHKQWAKECDDRKGMPPGVKKCS